MNSTIDRTHLNKLLNRVLNMKISVTDAAKQWGVSRTTIYQKINNGELSRGSDKLIDTAELLRCFGEPSSGERSENVLNTEHVQTARTPLNTTTEHIEQRQENELRHQLELERLRNELLQQQIKDLKQTIENQHQQISQLNKNLSQATASINEFAQSRLLELKQSGDPKSEAPEPQPEFNKKTTETKSGIIRKGLAKLLTKNR